MTEEEIKIFEVMLKLSGKKLFGCDHLHKTLRKKCSRPYRYYHIDFTFFYKLCKKHHKKYVTRSKEIADLPKEIYDL